MGREHLLTLMAGRHPQAGAELRRIGPDGSRVAAIDVTWSPPKSVSAVWAVADPRLRAEIEEAWHASVAEGIDHIGHQLEVVRQRDAQSQVRHVSAAGVIAAEFMHSTSRLTRDQELDGIPDPQLTATSCFWRPDESTGASPRSTRAPSCSGKRSSTGS